MGIVFGFIVMAIGVLMVWKSDGFMRAFGEITWAEENLSGGTVSFYKIFGLIVCFFGVLMVSGMFGGFLLWIMKPLFGSSVG